MADSKWDARHVLPTRPLTSWALSDSDYRLMVDAVSDYAIFFLDPKGYVLTWNKGAHLLKGYEDDEIIGQHFSIFYPQSRIDEGWPDQELAAALENGSFEDEGWRVRKDGTTFWANVIITRLVNESGEFRGYSKITRDLSERRQQQELLRLSEERFRLLVDGVKDYAISMLDPDGNIVSWNVGAQQSTGYRSGEVLGRHFSMFYPEEPTRPHGLAGELAQTLRDGHIESDGWQLRKSGGRYWANITITALYDEAGVHRGFAMVTRDLSERQRISALEDESRRITTFLAMLGHELRNPLTPIANALQLLEREAERSDRLRATHQIIGRQLRHITRLVDDLLDLGRITSGKIQLERELLCLSEVVREAAEIAQSQFEQTGQSLMLTIASEPIWINGDRVRLLQVIGNLLSNAAKFTPASGSVILSLRRRGSTAEISVKDNGSGIPPGLLPKIFELFVQGEQDVARPHGGLGLGLSLVRQLVALHGGQVNAYSNGKAGDGSEFLIHLPIRDTPQALPKPEAAAHGNVSGRILVVDDNQDAADTLACLLETFGYETRVAYDGHSALLVAEHQRPDVALLDVGLSGINGLDLARMLSRREPPPHLIAVSGYGQANDRLDSAAAGFHLHMTKPVDTEKLLSTLDELLRAKPV